MNIFDRKLIYSSLEIIRRLGGVAPGRTIDGLVGVLEDFLCRTVHIFVAVQWYVGSCPTEFLCFS